MDLKKLYKMQEELDNYIWEKHGTLNKLSKSELLDNTILALLVEVGELANTTRCFKHWSTKGMMEKEVVLDELADVLHFYLSIGNQLGSKGIKWNSEFNNKAEKEQIRKERSINEIFKYIYHWVPHINTEDIEIRGLNYQYVGEWISILTTKLDLTNEEIEQAYLKKHEENYRRQEEGY